MEQEGRKIGRFEDGSNEVIGALIEVHRFLGPGLLESAYEACVCVELRLRALRFERQRAIHIDYKGFGVQCGYRIDLVVEDRILVELKAVDRLLPIHEAQVVTYLKLSGLPIGLLVNFNVFALRQALRRLTRDHPTFQTFRPSDLPVLSNLSNEHGSQVTPGLYGEPEGDEQEGRKIGRSEDGSNDVDC